MKSFHRGSTPTIRFSLPFSCEAASKVRIIFSQFGDVKITKNIEDCIISGSTIAISLSEQDTLSLESDNFITESTDVSIQIKVGFGEGRTITNICKLRVKPILEEGAL